MTQRVRYRVGQNEIEVEGDVEFIEKQLEKFFSIVATDQRTQRLPGPPAEELPISGTVSPSDGLRVRKEISPSEFFRQKSPKSGTEILLVLSKYLEDFRNVKEFGGKEINKLAGEAKLKDVHSQYFTTAVQQGLLRQNGPGRYSITITGEDLVSSLPATKAG